MQAISYWDRTLSIGWLAFSPILLHFVIYYNGSEKVKKKLPLLWVYVPFIVLYILYMNNAKSMYTHFHPFWGWIAEPRENSLDLFQRVCIPIPVILALIVLHHAFIHAQDKQRKRQALLIGIGVSLCLVQGLFTQVFLALNGNEVPLTSSFLTFFSLGTIISLKRYNLFNISEAISTEQALENINTPILIIGSLGQIIYANPSAQRQFGLENRSTPYHIYKILNPFLKDIFLQKVLLRIQSGESIGDFEIELLKADGSLFDSLINCELIHINEKCNGAFLIINDISKIKNQQRTIEFQMGQMRQIAYIQSHVIRAPLSRIISIGDILKEEHDRLSDDEREQFLKYLSQSAHELDNELRNIVNKASPPKNTSEDEEAPGSNSNL